MGIQIKENQPELYLLCTPENFSEYPNQCLPPRPGVLYADRHFTVTIIIAQLEITVWLGS